MSLDLLPLPASGRLEKTCYDFNAREAPIRRVLASYIVTILIDFSTAMAARVTFHPPYYGKVFGPRALYRKCAPEMCW